MLGVISEAGERIVNGEGSDATGGLPASEFVVRYSFTFKFKFTT